MAESVDFEKLKQQIPLKDLLAHYGLLEDMRVVRKKSKAHLRGLCPFCGDAKAFCAYEDNRYYCHSCKARGSIIDLVMLMEGCTTRDAGLNLKAWFLSDAKKPQSPEANPQETAQLESAPEDDICWKIDLALLWDYFDEISAESKYYDALGRLEDIISTYGPFNS